MQTNTEAGFEVLTLVVMKSTIFWDITQCSPLKVSRRFGGTLRMVVRWSCETSADFQRTTEHFVPEDSTLHTPRRSSALLQSRH
jgi:hypothetical protein